MDIDNNMPPQTAKYTHITPQLAMQHSGLELLNMMIAGELAGPPISRLLNFRLRKADEGFAVFHAVPTLDHYNPAGTVHGGWAATVMDSALGCAVQSMLAPGVMFTTIELKVNLVRPMFEDSGEMVCEGRIIHFGRTIATSEAKMTNPDGKLVAHGTSTCAVFKAPG